MGKRGIAGHSIARRSLCHSPASRYTLGLFSLETILPFFFFSLLFFLGGRSDLDTSLFTNMETDTQAQSI